MESTVWRAELAGPCPAMTEHQLQRLRPRALARGVRLDLATSAMRATFSVSAPDLDHAIARARRRWESTVATLGLPETRLSHFVIDEVTPPPRDSSATVRTMPTPRPRAGAAWLDLPVAGAVELDDAAAGAPEHREPARLLAIR